MEMFSAHVRFVQHVWPQGKALMNYVQQLVVPVHTDELLCSTISGPSAKLMKHVQQLAAPVQLLFVPSAAVTGMLQVASSNCTASPRELASALPVRSSPAAGQHVTDEL